MPETIKNYIGGQWTETESGKTITVSNPANTASVVNTYQQSSAADAEKAVAAAAKATDKWANTSASERGAILRNAAGIIEDQKEELTELLTKEEGKTLSEARPEVQRAIDIFYYYSEKAVDVGGTIKNASGDRRQVSTKKEPLGVAALVTPWNYPIAIPAWKMAPALATGNTVVFKPASAAPGVGCEIVCALDKAGIPDGVVNLVTGPGSEVGDIFTSNADVDAVSFTGSSEVGHQVYRSATGDTKRAQAEMGGKNPAIVMPTADLGEAIDIVESGAFGVTGQACTATSRAIVHTDIYNEFVDGIVQRAEAIDVGPGIEDPDMGPQVNQNELDSTLEYIDIAEAEGATRETGGNRLRGDLGDGYFVSPAVYSNVEPDMRIAQEEVFGPVLSVIEVEDFEQAIQVANDSKYGLSASIVTADLNEAHEFANRVESGVVKINEKTTGLELHVPFGGVKRSSTNTYREQGDAAIDFYTQNKTVYLST